MTNIKECPECNGRGVVNVGQPNEEQCSNCGGKGFVPADDDGDEGVLQMGERP